VPTALLMAVEGGRGDQHDDEVFHRVVAAINERGEVCNGVVTASTRTCSPRCACRWQCRPRCPWPSSAAAADSGATSCAATIVGPARKLTSLRCARRPNAPSCSRPSSAARRPRARRPAPRGQARRHARELAARGAAQLLLGGGGCCTACFGGCCCRCSCWSPLLLAATAAAAAAAPALVLLPQAAANSGLRAARERACGGGCEARRLRAAEPQRGAWSPCRTRRPLRVRRPRKARRPPRPVRRGGLVDRPRRSARRSS
jgi:hypothetical protein